VAHPAPAGVGVEDQAHLAEVHLQLGPGLAVGHSHGRRPGRAADVEHLQRVAVKRALGQHHALALQFVGLDHGQVLVDQPGLQLVVVGGGHRPGSAVAVGAVGTNRFAHNGNQLVAERLLAGVTVEAGTGGRLHVAPHRLSVDGRQPGDGALPLAPQPQPQDLSNLVHWNLPEAHRHLPGPLSVRWRCQPQRRRWWWMLRDGPMTGEEVVPCCWRNSPSGGPMLLAGDGSAPALGSVIGQGRRAPARRRLQRSSRRQPTRHDP